MRLLVITGTVLVICLGLITMSRRRKSAPPAVVPEPPPQQAETPPTLLPPTPLLATADPLPDYDPTLDLRDYRYPTLDLLDAPDVPAPVPDEPALEAAKTRMTELLRSFHIEILSITASAGASVTLYEIVPAPGVRVARVKHLEDELALGLARTNIRIIAPIPGKGTIGIEVPNDRQSIVGLRSLLGAKAFQDTTFALPIAIGCASNNDDLIVDLRALPNLLIAGATGQGKSIGLHAIIASLLYKKHPSELKLVLINPQRIELNQYRGIEKHFLAKLPGQEEPIVTEGKNAVETLSALCIEMDNRYDLLHEAQSHDVTEYNGKFMQRRLNPQKGHQYLPFIAAIMEDFPDLLQSDHQTVETAITRLADRGPRVGIHLILSTSRVSADVLSHELKAHFPVRMVYKLTSRNDSKAVLDEPGAERLLGKGDLLFKRGDTTTRIQGAFIDTPEVERITDFIGHQRGYPEAYKLPEYVDANGLNGRDFDLADRDPLFEEAARLIVINQLGSTSLIQRKMKLGYNRAGHLMDQLEAAGVVGPGMGSKPRAVLFKTEMELDQYLR